MGEENRDSSGSSTVMIVIAILGGVLLLGCCGGVVVLAGGVFYARARAVDAMEVMDAQQVQIQQELKMDADKLRQEMEILNIPGEPPVVAPPESAPIPAPPTDTDKKE
jgi:hypothetical protein